LRSQRIASLTFLGACAGALSGAGVAWAQSFPADDEYAVLACGEAAMTDRHRDEPGAVDERDLVGDGVHAAGYRAVDDEFLYLRLRLDGDPAPGGTLRPFAWGVEIDIDGDYTDYEILGMVDGVSGNILLFRNTASTPPNDPSEPPDTPAVATYPFSSHGRSTTASGTKIGDNADYFLSFALPWSQLAQLGLERNTPVVVWAASSSSAGSLDGDFACHDGASGAPTLSGIASGRTVFDPRIDSDGDGVPDADELAGGTDPLDPSSYVILAGGGGCAATGRAQDVGAAAGWGFLVLLAMAWRRRRALTAA
jgi:uncharacterized protein (TIGR03382 family)